MVPLRPLINRPARLSQNIHIGIHPNGGAIALGKLMTPREASLTNSSSSIAIVLKYCFLVAHEQLHEGSDRGSLYCLCHVDTRRSKQAFWQWPPA